MFDKLHNNVYDEISDYIDQRDRYNLLYLNKQLFVVWIVHYCRGHGFVYRSNSLKINPKCFHFMKTLHVDLSYWVSGESTGIPRSKPITSLCLKNITSLEFLYLDSGGQTLKPGDLPPNLKVLTFRNSYSEERILPGALPESMEVLTFSHIFNQKILHGMLPKNLHKLVLGDCYNQPLEKVLPPNLKSLIFSYESSFNQPLEEDVLPEKLELLYLGFCFDKDIKDILPKNLKILKFGHRFKKRLTNGIFPNSLEELTFESLHQDISPGILPENLKYLSINDGFYDIRTNALPDSLESLILDDYEGKIHGMFPVGLRCLDLGQWMGNDVNNQINFEMFPNTLEKLVLARFFDSEIMVGTLPNKLKSLTFGVNYDKPIGPNVLPDSLEYLSFSHKGTPSKFSQQIGLGILPRSLKCLDMSSVDYGDALILEEGVLPETLEFLAFSPKFNQIIKPGILPKMLRVLNFTNCFKSIYNQRIGKRVLPRYLMILSLPEKYPYLDEVKSIYDGRIVKYLRLEHTYLHKREIVII